MAKAPAYAEFSDYVTHKKNLIHLLLSAFSFAIFIVQNENRFLSSMPVQTEQKGEMRKIMNLSVLLPSIYAQMQTFWGGVLNQYTFSFHLV